MALPLHEILTRPTYIQPVRVIIKRCGNPRCKHVISSHDGHEYLHSKANDNFYCDAVCLSKAVEVEIDWQNPNEAKVQWMLNEWECELRG